SDIPRACAWLCVPRRCVPRSSLCHWFARRHGPRAARGKNGSVEGQWQAMQRDEQYPVVPAKAGPSFSWIPAISAFTLVFDALCAGMNGSEALRRALFRRALAQDVPELGLERGERFHQRGGIELPGDAGRQLVCGIIGKMSPVCLAIQHRAAPRCCPWSIAWSGLRLG